jgi:hypothetical protein
MNALHAGYRSLWKAMLGAVLALALLGFSDPSKAAAIDIGLTSGGSLANEAKEWDVMKKSGAKVFRLMMARPLSGETLTQKFAALDNVFKLAAERGIAIQPYLYDFSQRFPTQAEWEPPGNAWETWVYQVVHRYGYSGEFWAVNPSLPYKPVTAWEVWNEPNLKENNPGGTAVQPENYARFLKRTAAAIQAAQKERSGGGTQVLFAGLISTSCGVNCVPGSRMSVSEFLQKAHNVSEVGTAFNGLSLHPYSHRSGVPGLQANVNEGRTALTTNFSSGKSLWITELGWALTDEGEAVWVSGQQAAENLTGSFSWIKSVAGEKNIQELIWFMYRSCECGLHWANWTGLRWTDGTYTAAWYAFQRQTGAGIWPTGPWSVDNLGGNQTSDPDISSWGYGRLDFFARGTTSDLSHKWYAGQFSSWESLGGNLVSGPGAVSWGPNRIDIAGRASNGTVTHWAWNGSGWFIDNLGGNVTSDVDISSWGYGRLDFFAKGPNNELLHRAYDGTWSAWESLGGNLASGPGAVSWGPNRIDVVARATDNSVLHWAWNGSGWYLDNLGGNITSDPDASSWGYGRLDFFARSASGEIVHKQYDGEWSDWEGIGGPAIVGGPGAVSWNGERIDVVGRLANNTIGHWAWTIPTG